MALHRHVGDVLATLRARGADERLLHRLEAVAENRCGDPDACARCEARCLDAPDRPPVAATPAAPAPIPAPSPVA